jgi:geranylgeranyl pyrophosphate synthase
MNLAKLAVHKSQTFDDLYYFYSPFIEKALEQSLPDQINDARNVLKEAVLYSLLNGGKRIRPLLTLTAHHLFHDNYMRVMPVAVALEMIHAYSLIHDDLPSMDDDDFRRGKPSSHKQFGEDIAILAGDTLNTLAFETLSTQLDHFDAKDIVKVIQTVAKLSGINGLVGGQVLDINSAHEQQTLEALKAIHSKKTAALFECCIVCPALLENEATEVITILQQFSEHLGLLFQIVDDILDVTESKETLGKTPNKDVELNKLTYIKLFGLDKAKDLAKQEALFALKCLDQLDSKRTEPLKLIVGFILNRTH